MIKMIIKMDENKIERESGYSAAQIYHAIDKVFNKMGYACKKGTDSREYCGTNNPRDFGKFGIIYNTLKRQDWFMNNAQKWILCNSDDADDPNDFSEEDLLAFRRNKMVASQ